jgi:hypothetical protein
VLLLSRTSRAKVAAGATWAALGAGRCSASWSGPGRRARPERARSGCSATARQREALDRFAGRRWPADSTATRRTGASCAGAEAQLREIADRARERAPGGGAAALGLAEVETVAPAAGARTSTLRAEADGCPTPRSCRPRRRRAARCVGDAESGEAARTSAGAGLARRRTGRPSAARPRAWPSWPPAGEVGYLLATPPPSAPPTPPSRAPTRCGWRGRGPARALAGLTRHHGEDVDEGAGLGRAVPHRLAELDDDDRIEPTGRRAASGLRVRPGGGRRPSAGPGGGRRGRAGLAVTAELQELVDAGPADRRVSQRGTTTAV